MVGKIDPKKLDIIHHVDGPMLVIAGPGAGKTMAIVERVVHLIGKCGVAADAIFISTFTDKAARELLTRISRRLMEENLKVSPNEMYIGTMHSLFLRILKDNSEFTRLKKNYKTFDDFDQKYTVYRKMYAFKKIENFELLTNAQSNWSNAEKLCGLLNKVREEALDPETLLSAPEPEEKALAESYRLYCDILEGENAIDFSAIQSEMLSLLEADGAVLEKLREQLRYFIVEEKLGKRVSKMHLYFTRVEDENPYVSWEYDPARVEGTLRSFSRTVEKIENHRFSNNKVVKCQRLCDGCDMRFYCNYK